MSIAGILSSAFLQSQLSATKSPYQQQLHLLSQDLKSGNLSAAQSDFATLQAAFSQSGTTSASTSTSPSNPVAQAFNQLATDLQSGNLSAAQKDFSTVQQVLQSQASSSTNHFHYHHRLSSGSGPGAPITPTPVPPIIPTPVPPIIQDPLQVGQSLTASNFSDAQQAYATPQQRVQQFALGGGAPSSQAGSLLVQPGLSLNA